MFEALCCFLMIRNLLLSVVLAWTCISASHAQDLVSISGKIYDVKSPELLLENTMVINLRTQRGVFAEGNNSFSVQLLPSDTLVISATGYQLKKVCFKDTSVSRYHQLHIPLERLTVQLRDITIFQQRDWKAIERDLQRLGYQESDYRIQGAEAWNAPITALYEAFSRRERSRRKVAELQNADMRRDLLKEILHIYSKNGLIQLAEEETERFIDYMDFNDDLLKTLTQYELAVLVKERFAAFKDYR